MQKKSNLTSWTIYYWSKSFTLALNEKFEHRVDNWFDAARPTGNGMRWVWIHSNTMYSWIVQWVVRVNRSRTRWILVLMNSKFRVHLTALHFAQLKWLVEIDNVYPSKYCGESRGSNVSSFPIAIVSTRMKSTLAVFIAAIWVLRVKLRRIWLSTATGHQDQISLR